MFLGLTFSVVAVGFIAAFGLGIWVYFWWKTRKIRRAMKNHTAPADEVVTGEVIEGEATVVEETSTVVNKPHVQQDEHHTQSRISRDS
ncbi:MAG: hypothetical protein PHV80_08295 [Rugosibacter sp.]|nr:hypothetical protein [Rugosibacter sp.]